LLLQQNPPALTHLYDHHLWASTWNALHLHLHRGSWICIMILHVFAFLSSFSCRRSQHSFKTRRRHRRSWILSRDWGSTRPWLRFLSSSSWSSSLWDSCPSTRANALSGGWGGGSTWPWRSPAGWSGGSIMGSTGRPWTRSRRSCTPRLKPWRSGGPRWNALCVSTSSATTKRCVWSQNAATCSTPIASMLGWWITPLVQFAAPTSRRSPRTRLLPLRFTFRIRPGPTGQTQSPIMIPITSTLSVKVKVKVNETE